MKTYNVTWSEKHTVIVQADNSDDAIERAQNGYGTDDSAEVDCLEATQVCDVCRFEEDDNGNCHCTNKDGLN